MGILEFMPAPRRILRHLASEPDDFAEEHGIRLHELAQTVAQHSLDFVRTFSLETPAHWFGYFAIEGETQQMAGTCSFKGPPDDGVLEIAIFTFPGFEGRGIGTEMARFLVERARTLPGVKSVIAHTLPEANASSRIMEKIGMSFAGEGIEDGDAVWRWEIALQS